MAIDPDPSKLETTLTLRDGRRVRVRSIRPADASMDRAFFAGLSEQSRYMRFMQTSLFPVSCGASLRAPSTVALSGDTVANSSVRSARAGRCTSFSAAGMRRVLGTSRSTTARFAMRYATWRVDSGFASMTLRMSVPICTCSFARAGVTRFKGSCARSPGSSRGGSREREGAGQPALFSPAWLGRAWSAGVATS